MAAPDYLFNDALARFEAGELAHAEQVCVLALNHYPNTAAFLDLLSAILSERGDALRALQLAQAAVSSTPGIAEYWNNLGALWRNQHQLDDAKNCFLHALDLSPENPGILTNLAAVLVDLGELADACAVYQRALVEASAPIKTYIQFAGLLERQGHLDQAHSLLLRALEREPESPATHNNLAGILLKLGHSERAITHCLKALQLQPQFPEARHNLGVAYAAQGKFKLAIDQLVRVVADTPDFLTAYCSLGDIYADQGRMAEAADAYRAAAYQHDAAARIKLALIVTPIPSSRAQILDNRASMQAAIRDLRNDPALKLDDPVRQIGACPFYLTYQGLGNRELMTQIADLYQYACPELMWTAPHCQRRKPRAGRIRIGFISKHMYRHSIGRTTQGVFARLPRERFERVAIFIAPVVDDDLSQSIRASADVTLVVQVSLQAAREQIAALELDILFYQDIGMEPFSYFLSFARLAPIQCTSFGHPDTSGLANVDYFISSNLFETELAAEDYSEKLVLLNNVGTLAYYYKPELTETAKSRSDFGLPLDSHLYLCLQTLFKLHPDMDQLFAAILRKDAHGIIVLLQGTLPHFVELLRARFAATLPDVAHRILFLPNLPHSDYLNLLAIGNVVLDPPHFCGMNSTLEAFAVGTPVVTLPSQLQRGRHTLGMYVRMGINECIARSQEEYVNIAINLANNRPHREQLKKRILTHNHVLFEDDQVVDGFARFFQSVVGNF